MKLKAIVALAQVKTGAITARLIAENDAWKVMTKELQEHQLIKMDPNRLVLGLTRRGRQYLHDLERVKLPKVGEDTHERKTGT